MCIQWFPLQLTRRVWLSGSVTSQEVSLFLTAGLSSWDTAQFSPFQVEDDWRVWRERSREHTSPFSASNLPTSLLQYILLLRNDSNGIRSYLLFISVHLYVIRLNHCGSHQHCNWWDESILENTPWFISEWLNSSWWLPDILLFSWTTTLLGNGAIPHQWPVIMLDLF